MIINNIHYDGLLLEIRFIVHKVIDNFIPGMVDIYHLVNN